MGQVVWKRLFFRREEVSVPSSDWEEFCLQYEKHGLPTPAMIPGEKVSAIFYRDQMIGGFISSRDHGRYRSYISESDSDSKEWFSCVTWNANLFRPFNMISINCNWRRIDSGLIGNVGTLITYLEIMNTARKERCNLISGASDEKLKALYRSWGPVGTCAYKHIGGSINELFIFRPEAGYSAMWRVLKNIVSSKCFRKQMRPPAPSDGTPRRLAGSIPT